MKIANRKFWKTAVDVLMFADFLFLMAHEVVRDLWLHGVLGTVLFLLFILHHALNGGFWKTLFKGRYGAQRILLVSTDGLLFLLMLLMAFSSVMMSGAVFSFSPVSMEPWSRPLHTFSTSWGFLVMSFHLGLHLHPKMKRLNAKAKFFPVLWTLLFALGIFCIVKTEFYIYLFWLNAWKISSASLGLYTAELLSISAGMICLAHGVSHLTGRLKK